MQLNESNIVEAMENRDLNTLRLDLDLYPKLKQMQPRLDSVIEENYIKTQVRLEKMSIIQVRLYQWIRSVKRY